MSAFSLSTAAGPSTATLKALSEYCASSDSPNSSFSHSESFLSYVTPVSSPKVVPELPDIIVQSDRFQSTSVQEKMVKALKFSTGSGFTRRAPTSSGRDRAVSTQAIYEGLPRLRYPGTYRSWDFSSMFEHKRVASVITTCLALRITNTRRGRSCGHTIIQIATVDPTSSCSPPATPPAAAPASETLHSDDRVSSSQRYAGLGHGLPSHMNDSTASSRFTSTFTLYSVRSISTVLSMVPSGSYPHALLNRLPILARCSRFEQDVATQNAGTGPFARLRAGAVSFVRERLRKVSAVAVGPSPASVFGGESRHAHSR
ncbi:hypothetical protein B0H13DRAFT_2339098 [Mycena leptocephala]|nr:hypothetical protein B0H13DRAFT_2339098 [Mycena leptocephala]